MKIYPKSQVSKTNPESQLVKMKFIKINIINNLKRQAIEYYEFYLAIVKAMNDQVLMGRAYGNLGNAHYRFVPIGPRSQVRLALIPRRKMKLCKCHIRSIRVPQIRINFS